MKKDLKLYDLKELYQYITLSLTMICSFHLQKEDKKSDVQPSGRVSLDEGPNDTQLRHNKSDVIHRRHLDVEGKSLLYASRNHDKVCLNQLLNI